MTDISKPPFTTAQAASIRGCSVKTIRRYCIGDPPLGDPPLLVARKVGNHWLIFMSADEIRAVPVQKCGPKPVRK